LSSTEPEDSATQTSHSFDIRQDPFHDLLRIQSIDARDGKCRVELLVVRQHLRNLGIVHGGVIASLLDTAMGIAASTFAPPFQAVLTAQLNVNFIRPVKERESLVATGEIIHSGRQTAVARGEVRTADGLLVASGSATFMYRGDSG
jgi:uncharacterized protein (TIGR00369 family)